MNKWMFSLITPIAGMGLVGLYACTTPVTIRTGSSALDTENAEKARHAREKLEMQAADDAFRRQQEENARQNARNSVVSPPPGVGGTSNIIRPNGNGNLPPGMTTRTMPDGTVFIDDGCGVGVSGSNLVSGRVVCIPTGGGGSSRTPEQGNRSTPTGTPTIKPGPSASAPAPTPTPTQTASATPIPTATTSPFPTPSRVPGVIDFSRLRLEDPLNDAKLSVSGGAADFTVPTNNDFDFAWGFNAPRLLTSAQGNFTIRVTVKSSPSQHYQSAGLVLIDRSTTSMKYYRIERAYESGANWVKVWHNPGINKYTINKAFNFSHEEVELTLERIGNRLTSSFKRVGDSTPTVASEDIADLSNTVDVGLMVINHHNNNQYQASFRELSIQGVVP